MKKFRTVAAVTVAVLSMSVNAMAAPLHTELSDSLSKGLNLSIKNACVQAIGTHAPIGQTCATAVATWMQDVLTDLPETENDNLVFGCDVSAGNGNADSKPDSGVNDGATDSILSAYEQRVVDLVNEERAKEGLSALQVDAQIAAAADVRAKEIRISFSHTRPDGRDCFTTLNEAGVSYRGAGENIAKGYRTPEDVVTAWMNSEGHRKNIMNASFRYIGVGLDGNAWAQLFTH